MPDFLRTPAGAGVPRYLAEVCMCICVCMRTYARHLHICLYAHHIYTYMWWLR